MSHDMPSPEYLDMLSDVLAQVKPKTIKVTVPYQIVHTSSGTVISDGVATFQNGKAIVITLGHFYSIAGPVKTPGTLDGTIYFCQEHPEFELKWGDNEHIRITEG